jgi:hypothetical protein
MRHDPPDASVHVPVHVTVESTMHKDPVAHSTSSMQVPPSGTWPENAAIHGAGRLGWVQKSVAQSTWDSAVKQAVAAASSKSAVPLDTAVTAADAVLKPSVTK